MEKKQNCLIKFFVLLFFYSAQLCFSQENSESLAFKEIWGYVMSGHEQSFTIDMPITDIGYFASSIGVYSTVLESAPREKYFSDFSGRVHLVSSVDSKSQTHLLLDPKMPLRKSIIEALVKAAATYEGLQIDWELVPEKDADNFYTFLVDLKKKLNKKVLTVAIPARVKTLEKDPYNYKKLSKVADKILIMAYDQHWSTSAPGPIASPDWCKRIHDYAKTQIPEEKLIMGLPFYGRAWTDDKIGSRAWIMPSIERIISENQITDSDIKTDNNGNKYFKLKMENTITVYFDNLTSCYERLQMYHENGAERIGFWRIGQENTEIWNFLETKD